MMSFRLSVHVKLYINSIPNCESVYALPVETTITQSGSGRKPWYYLLSIPLSS